MFSKTINIKTDSYLTMNYFKLPFLSSLYLHKYIFHCSAIEKILLAKYKGSIIRGSFGKTLKNIVCINRKASRCKNCKNREECLYVYIFDTMPVANDPNSRKYATPPRPFIILPPLTKKTTYEKHEPLSFEVTLFGKSNKHLPYFIKTFEEMGKNGIGDNNGRFKIKGIDLVMPNGDIEDFISLINNNSNTSSSSSRIDLNSIKPFFPKFTDNKISVSFETPLRYESKGKLIKTSPTFDTIIEGLLRRIFLLSYFHCGENSSMPDINIKKEVLIKKNYLKWVDIARYSFRKKKELPTGGLMGTIIYQGNISPYLKILKLGEYLHLGKYTVFGNGKYRIF
ncbi:CRISPR system precrRNA processing endoribonuclease RAMP protein Cas6 [bacterium]|nr:CRISPR system precrRNA processing endoribonuclease RAMP protein Cas6 [bacterium]